MDNEEFPMTPRSNSKYHPLPESDMERSNAKSPPSRSAWRIAFQKYMPFCVHFTLIVLVATICLCVLNGRSFNINSRQPQYTEVDGSVSHKTSYAPLQSDITTGVSLAATATRVAGGWWAAGYIWRSILISMEGGGISLEGLSQVISSWPPAPRHFTRRSDLVIIYITLFVTFALDYFSAVLTGSFVWESGNMLIPGGVPITGIQSGASGGNPSGFFTDSDQYNWVVGKGCGYANLAWPLQLQPNSTSNTMEPWTFRRVVNGARYLVKNSTLNNVTVPYFMVDTFEWIQDPGSILTSRQSDLIVDYTQFNPYFFSLGIGGLLPDHAWGPSSSTNLDPHTIFETRLFTFRVNRIYPNETDKALEPCPQNYMVDPGTQVNLHMAQIPAGGYTDCFAIANMTYRAGAAKCYNCPLIYPAVLDVPPHLPFIQDSFTSMALALAPSLGSNLIVFSNYSPPWNYGTRKNFFIEFTSRTYQAAWAAVSDWYGTEHGDTIVQISLPTLRAKVIPWKVYLWVGLHLWVIVLGLFFVYVQSHYDHPWVKNTTMAMFWLDTSAILRLDGQGIDQWEAGTEVGNKGMLVLDNADQWSRSVKLKQV